MAGALPMPAWGAALGAVLLAIAAWIVASPRATPDTASVEPVASAPSQFEPQP